MIPYRIAGKYYVTIWVDEEGRKDAAFADSLMKRADTLLYQCKSAGRNCLRIG